MKQRFLAILGAPLLMAQCAPACTPEPAPAPVTASATLTVGEVDCTTRTVPVTVVWRTVGPASSVALLTTEATPFDGVFRSPRDVAQIVTGHEGTSVFQSDFSRLLTGQRFNFYADVFGVQPVGAESPREARSDSVEVVMPDCGPAWHP